MTTVIIFLIVLAVLIFVHELGHFLFAKMFGIRVDAFKIGFGPKIFAWRPKGKDGKRGETEYGLNLIPFGGYVKIFGENPDDVSDIKLASSPAFVNEENSRNMSHKPKWQQVIVLFGGVLFNFLFAVILYIGLFSCGVTATADGFPMYNQYFSNSRIMITDVLKDSPADKAGLKVGDIIKSISISKIFDKTSSSSINVANNPAITIDDIQNEINKSNGQPIMLVVDRGSSVDQISATPNNGIVANKYAIGIAMSDVADLRLPFFTSVYEGFHYSVVTLRDTVTGLYGFFSQLVIGKANLSEVTGPVGIAGIVGNAARLGFTYLLMITALISINLSVINLIPFPALDGGRILFVIIETIIRRPIPAKFANYANLIGFSLLMILMVLVTYKDILRIITG